MKTKSLGLILTLCFVAVSTSFAGGPEMGTWKLNEAKSKIAKGTGKNTTVVYSDVLWKTEVAVDGVDASGKTFHSTWSGKFDGKDYPVKGDPSSDMRSYKKVNERTLEFTAKKAGKVVSTGTIVVAGDGKSRTVHSSGTNAKGKKWSSTAVYDKA